MLCLSSSILFESTRSRAITAIIDVFAILDVWHDDVDQLTDVQYTQKLDQNFYHKLKDKVDPLYRCLLTLVRRFEDGCNLTFMLWRTMKECSENQKEAAKRINSGSGPLNLKSACR